MSAQATEVTRLRPVLAFWERARVVYNLLMLATGLTLSWHLKPHMEGESGTGYWGNLVLFGVVANVFFCLGPFLEASALVWWGRDFGRGRWGLFALGLMFSLGCVVLLIEMLRLQFGLLFH